MYVKGKNNPAVGVLVHNGAVLANNRAVIVKPVESKKEAA
jgi:hypothetical protein